MKWKITNFNRIAGSLGIKKETSKVKKKKSKQFLVTYIYENNFDDWNG